MSQWIHVHVAIIAALVGCISTLLFVFMWWFCHHKKDQKRFVESNSLNKRESQERNNHFDQRRKSKGRKDLFSWNDHPYLASDAIENGWSRFAFTSYMSNISSKKPTSSTLLGSCGGSDEFGRENEAEISWEVCQGSNEFMQKIRLNPGLKECFFHPNNSSTSVASVIRTSLPLPGPFLGNHAFPQEAYFEITILYSSWNGDYELVGRREGEKTKLLIEDISNDEGDLKSVEEMKVEGKGGISESVMLSLGLTGGGGVPLRVPGTYPRSIGFNSNGSVFLDGMKLVFESEKAQWVGTDTVIGCGFDPRQKKVFFTLNSELVHVIYCQSEEFSTPLCPTLAANIDIMVLVNFGQIAFKYAPANAQRTPNPCFIAPLVHSPGAALGFDDSKELFSMGRIDSPWQNRSATKGNNINGNNNLAIDFDEESEADLFEIVLDGTEKSPYSVSLS